MDRIRTVATFVAGVLVGGSAVYFSPPETGAAATAPPTGAPPPDGHLPPPVTMGVPGQGLPGQGGGLDKGPEPGSPGAPGTIPGAPGEVPPGGTPGAVPPGMPDGATAGTVPGMPGAEGVAAAGAPTGENVPVAGEIPGAPPDEIPAAPPSAVQQSGSRLEKHLRIASSVWGSQAATAKASSNAEIRALVSDIEAHAESVPAIGDHMPPMQEVAGYLASSRVLLDRMAAAGMEVADLSLQVDMMMRPPKGKIPGGPKATAGN